ncbi:MAG: SLC13 family permease, partial [Promethearchaeota archaeon]
MLISIIIAVICFIIVIILIVSEKLNRAIAAIAGGFIVYLVLIYLEGFDFSILVELLFGSPENEYSNLHALMLIIAMMIIVLISNEAGLFQFIAVKLIIYSKGKPIRLLMIICVLTVIISAILNNILTVIILIPITITTSRILNTNPTPYILTQAVLVNIGGTIFSISSIPNILITTYAKISFIDFFLTVGLISIVIFFFTLIFFVFLYKKELFIPKGGAEILKEFNVWNFVPNKTLLIECMIAFIVLFIMFILIPPTLLSPDIFAWGIAILLLLISKLNPREIITKIDFELIFYLLGVFIITGALEILGFAAALGVAFANLAGDDILIQIILILWISALLSSSIDNIPITKVLIPIIAVIPDNGNNSNKNLKYYSLAIGANWGDNLTPLGDN